MERKISVSLVILALLLAMTSFNTLQSESDTEAELNTLWRAFEESWNALDPEACASFYHTDAVNIPPDMEIRSGRAAIQSFYEWLFSMHTAAEYHHQIHSVSHEGNLAVERGTFSVNWTRNDGTTWLFSARSITHWEKDTEGRWMIKAFIFNAAPGE